MKPRSLAQLYERSVQLMDDARWSDAETVLEDLIRLSEQNGDSYFLTEARFRKIMCLKALGRLDEIPSLKSKIPPNAEVFMDDGKYRIEDL